MKKLFSLITAAGAAVLLTGCALLYPNWGTDQNPSTSASASPMSSASGSESPSPSASPLKKRADVDVLMAEIDLSAQSVYVVGEVTNVFEDGGQCVITLAQGNLIKEIKVKTETNVNSTQCFPGNVSYSGFLKGVANISVTYESQEFLGTSKIISVDIP